MKIIKVYKETTTAEKLYSVMLTEDEVALFSKMEDWLPAPTITTSKFTIHPF